MPVPSRLVFTPSCQPPRQPDLYLNVPWLLNELQAGNKGMGMRIKAAQGFCLWQEWTALVLPALAIGCYL